jgi:hypothetical protein
LRAEARVDRDRDRAEPRTGEEAFQPGRDVGQPQRDAVARPDAELPQPAGTRRLAAARSPTVDAAPP